MHLYYLEGIKRELERIRKAIKVIAKRDSSFSISYSSDEICEILYGSENLENLIKRYEEELKSE